MIIPEAGTPQSQREQTPASAYWHGTRTPGQELERPVLVQLVTLHQQPDGLTDHLAAGQSHLELLRRGGAAHHHGCLAGEQLGHRQRLVVVERATRPVVQVDATVGAGGGIHLQRHLGHHPELV